MTRGPPPWQSKPRPDTMTPMAATGAQSGYDLSASPPPVLRRLFHLVAGSSVPVAGIFAPEDGMVIALAVMAAGGLSLDLLRFRIGWLNQVFLRWFAPLLKPEEGHRITGATYMVIAALIVFYFFGTTIAVAAMMFLALGDPAAALVGRRTPGPRIWGKSPGGTAAFVAVSLLAVAVLGGTGAVDYHWALLAGAVVAGLVELAPLRLDDNLTVPVAAGAAMQLLMA